MKGLTYKKTVILLAVLTVISVLLFLSFGLTAKNMDFFLPRRMKKIGAILLTAYCIGYSSVTFQTITQNKILTPSVMGMDSMYQFVQTVIVFFFGSHQLAMMTGVSNFLLSIGVMLLFSCLLFMLLFWGEGKNVYFLVLAGMIIGGLFNGLATFMQVLLDPNEFLVLQGKMFASFDKVNEGLLGVSVIILIVVFIISYGDYAYLDVLSLGVDHTINLGIPYRRLVFKNLLCTAVLISVSTALTGPITFLGILVASISREIIKTYRHSWRVAGAVLLGAFALIFGQMAVERIFEFSTTISVIVNFIGGIYFIYLMIKEAKR